eukprot:TRINITY_DN2480_c0_g1_i2.p1 TRINITY_DN2480_c0_g1~~TRINITY_DN2480_c0_g1_i2.p1  ORF type:complete len:318 (+),score=72.17 TRINITY_DN2480_c0_g1_i2:162-1115(+)
MHCLSEAQWSVVGYFFYITGSVLYFAQAFGPWYPDLYNDPNFNNMNLAAAYIFIIESTIYMVGWVLGRQQILREGYKPIPILQDANLAGNLLFLLGSIGYAVTAHWSAQNVHPNQQVIVNFAMAVVFVVDSFLYLYAIKQGAHSTTSALAHDSRWCFDSPVDIYLIASIGFIIGSFVYMAAGIYNWMGTFGDGSTDYSNQLNLCYMLGAVVFVIDSPLYLLSGFQRRDVTKEVPFRKRRSTFFIENSEPASRKNVSFEDSSIMTSLSNGSGATPITTTYGSVPLAPIDEEKAGLLVCQLLEVSVSAKQDNDKQVFVA